MIRSPPMRRLILFAALALFVAACHKGPPPGLEKGKFVRLDVIGGPVIQVTGFHDGTIDGVLVRNGHTVSYKLSKIRGFHPMSKKAIETLRHKHETKTPYDREMDKFNSTVDREMSQVPVPDQMGSP